MLISGHDGGTGASPLTSLKHAGGPWELGLAETQQTLVLNGLRDRIVVQTDGQLKTGRDVVIAALLGAEEFGFATAPLVVSGCIMMRVCHLDTCPVGIATQNPELRERFTGKPEFVVTFFEYIAEEVRELLAALGFRSIDEAVGHASALDTTAAVDHWKASGLDLTPILTEVEPPDGAARHHTIGPGPRAGEGARPRAHRAGQRGPAATGTPVRDRAAGPQRQPHRRHHARARGHQGCTRTGCPTTPSTSRSPARPASRSARSCPRGITLRLEGDANDYVGKGLSGGRIVVRPDRAATLPAEHNVIAGNVIGYGATTGELFLRGRVGERFCVRNSGATAVVEGVGDHGCEYMTGGTRRRPRARPGATSRPACPAASPTSSTCDHDRVNPELVGLSPLRDERREGRARPARQAPAVDRLRRRRRLLADWDDVRGRASPWSCRATTSASSTCAPPAEAEGLDPDGSEVWERIMEASRG